MKSLVLVLAVLIISTENASADTTADLLRAQDELSLGHEFSELQLLINRNVISSYIHLVNQELIDSFMDTYSEIHMLADETREALTSLEQNACVSRVLARWDFQVRRFGLRLSACLRESFLEVNTWNDYVNTVHHTAQRTTTQVQNQGVTVLTETDDFTTRDSFYTAINRRFRILLGEADNYQERFEVFRRSVVENEEEIIQELTQCDRQLAALLAREAREDLEVANRCL